MQAIIEMTTRPKNALIMQSGGCTNVLNSSLFGIVSEAADAGAFGRVHGASHGLEGLLEGKTVDLTDVPQATWRRIARSPGAALGSTRRKLTPDDVPIVLGRLAALSIGYWFIIGGNDSAETGHTLSVEATKAGYDLTVVNVPKTIDNDLVMTDHCPGYGSAARFVALAAMGAGADAEAMGAASPITIQEVMGRDTGWLAAAAALGRREERDAPHVICLPETPVDEDRFVAQIEAAYTRFGFAVAVVSENARSANGVLGGQCEPWFVDDFGHPYYDGPAHYLSGLVSKRLSVRTRYEKPGTIQRSFVAAASRRDLTEAEMAGRAAVRAAMNGHTDVIVTLERAPGSAYECITGLAPLDAVGGKVRTMPSEFLDAAAGELKPAFLRYLRPLVGRLPRFARLG